MKRLIKAALALAVFCLWAGNASAQSPQGVPASGVISKSTKAVGYQVGGGSTMVDLKGTSLMPQAAGEAKVEAKTGVTNIEVKVTGMGQPSKLGTEFLTFVLWAVSPDGRTGNIGEIQTNKNGQGELKTTVQSQTFSLIVTAEPYFSVRLPSEMVVLENEIRKGTKGKIFVVNDYKLMRQGVYEKMGNPLALTLDLKNVPLEMYEARNAVDIAKSRKADQYAAEIFTKAEASLKMAENALTSKANKKEIISTARQAIQFSEDARALSMQRQNEEKIAQEKAAAAAKAKAEAEAKAAAEAAEAKRKADEEAQRQAELAAAREAQMKAEAESAALKAKAEQDALKAKEEAANAEAERQRQEAERAEREKQALRESLLEQFNRILSTRDTPRGLVVTMADVLFDTGKYNLRPEARERLARLAGIVLAHPGLNLEVEGHTDSVGSDEFNQKLSEQRAGSTRDYLIQQGLAEGNITAKGYGKTMPVADNSTADGRQKNRRVELIVSGEVIGTKIGR
ncbi:MAG TPA: OmpA family protein [Terriglobia bacterium]|nr:OmpA family protein [Terriglobia bacterium]